VLEKPRKQQDLFWCCTAEEMIPADHLLRQIDSVLDLSWLEEAVGHLYHPTLGRPGWHPEVLLRLLLARVALGIPSHRALMRQTQTDLALRWFIGCPPPERLPDHSSLSRALSRWGEELFLELFQRALAQCVEAGLADGRVLHVDGTLMRADVSYESLYREAVAPADEPPPEGAAPPPAKHGPGRPRTKPPRLGKKRSRTDPDCSLATKRKTLPLEPSYKHHVATDDQSGVVVAMVTTTGETGEGTVLPELLAQAEANTGVVASAVTGDSGYASAENFGLLERQGCAAVIAMQRERRPKKLPKERFRIDRRKRRAKCPAGRWMKAREGADGTVTYRGQGCGACPLRSRCVPDSTKVRTIQVAPDDEAWVRAKRRQRRGWDEPTRALYDRHRALAEGSNAQLKEQHGLRRARWRGRWKAAVQALLAATVVNLNKLATAKQERELAGRPNKLGHLGALRRPRRSIRRPDERRLAATGRGRSSSWWRA